MDCIYLAQKFSKPLVSKPNCSPLVSELKRM